jgi:anti-anti-sigma factor
MEPNLKLENGVLIVRVDGDLTSTTVLPLRRQLDEYFKSDHATAQLWTICKLDLRAARMIDSVGLNLVVSLLKTVQKRGATLQVATTDQNILRTLAFTRLDKQLELVKM